MVKASEPAWITVRFSRAELEIVLDVFAQMIEQRDEIDFGMMDLEPFEQFEALVDKIRPYRHSEESVVLVPMTHGEWLVYEPYVRHANDLVLEDHEGDLMADLHIRYARVNAAGSMPDGPV